MGLSFLLNMIWLAGVLIRILILIIVGRCYKSEGPAATKVSLTCLLSCGVDGEEDFLMDGWMIPKPSLYQGSKVLCGCNSV